MEKIDPKVWEPLHSMYCSEFLLTQQRYSEQSIRFNIKLLKLF